MQEPDTIIQVDIGVLAVAGFALLMIAANELHLWRMRRSVRRLNASADSLLEALAVAESKRLAAIERAESVLERAERFSKAGPFG